MRSHDVDDFDPLQAPTFSELMDEIREDKSKFSIAGIDEDLVTDVFQTFRDSAAARTIGADRSAWKKWKGFLARHNIRELWRRDHAANSGVDAAGHRREILLLRCFMVDVHRNMRPRRSRNQRARPKSALNVVGGVRRIHQRAGIDMVSSVALGTALKGLNRQYLRAEGHNGALLAERKEPLPNDEAALMLSVPNGTVMRGWSVDWGSAPGVSFRAALCAGRQGGFRKADVASLDEYEPHEMARANLTWYINVCCNGTFQHVAELPDGYQLEDGDCAVLRPAVSKADQSAEAFGNMPVYLPFIVDDPCNAASALCALERKLPCHGAQRKRVPLLIIDDAFNPLTCDMIDRMFMALSTHALGSKRAGELSFHSCRVFAACAHKANGEGDGAIQALCRWKTVESLKIYGRFNPLDYAARVRRMVNTRVDSTIAARLPLLSDDDLHRAIMDALPAISSGRDVSEICADDETDDECDGASPAAADAGSAAAGSRGVVRTAPTPRKRSRTPAGSPASAQPTRPAAVACTQQRAPTSNDHTARPRKRANRNERVVFQQCNPKRAGSNSHARYELYKRAATVGEFRDLGGSAADLKHDTKHGFATRGP